MLLYFAATLFVSASLLFLVQPMVGKMILPRLGGTPAVWNTCMVFFQAVLLMGYAYTHTLSGWHNRRRQLVVQLAILALPFLVLPFTLGAWVPPAESNPVFSVLWLLLGMVGLPFFVVATSAPLLQKWFAGTGHVAGKDPYFLYGASNLGSMLALLLYPLAVEPLFAVEEQAWVWTGGYAILVVLVAGCVAMVWQDRPTRLLEFAEVGADVLHPPAQPEITDSTAIQRDKKWGRPLEVIEEVSQPSVAADALALSTRELTWGRRLRWVGLAAAPSSLMLGVTTHLTTDIAAIPFFWVLPLALYLLTFILVFARWPVVWTGWPHRVVLYVQPFLLMVLVVILMGRISLPYTWLEFLLHVLVFFTTTLMCHGELAKDRPAIRYLTEFYLWMSVGGVLGGMFNALIAPLFFKMGVIEYPLAMILACLLRPNMVGNMMFIPGDSKADDATTMGRVLDLVLPLLIGLWTLLLLYYTVGKIQLYAKALVAVVVLSLASRPIRFGLSLAVFALTVALWEYKSEGLVFQDRSFFGFVKVRQDYDSQDNKYYALIHGGINHGWQALDPEHRRDPITYFHPTGGIGQIFQKFSWPDARLPASMVGLGGSVLGPWGTVLNTQSEPPYAVVGLGIGTLASHAKPYQHMRFYEIDPVIKRLSLPPEGQEPIFHYLQDALARGSDLDVIMGDGRLSLKKAPENYYHILVLDAFSSDAIPVHLLTKEAVELYLTKLAEGGLLIFNTTNRYVDINGVLADLAENLDLTCYYYGDYGDESMPTKFGSDWVVLQRKNLGVSGRPYNGGLPLEQRVLTERAPGQTPWEVPDKLGGPVWTDRYSNLLRVLRWR